MYKRFLHHQKVPCSLCLANKFHILIEKKTCSFIKLVLRDNFFLKDLRDFLIKKSLFLDFVLKMQLYKCELED
jgi:hypothetical protein